MAPQPQPLPVVFCVLLAALTVTLTDGRKQTVYADVGEFVTLECSVLLDRGAITIFYWKISDGTRLLPGQSETTIQVLDAGWALRVPKVTDAHYGKYTCAYNATTGPQKNYFELLERRVSSVSKYRLNTLVGVGSALAAFVIIAFLYALYNCTWEKRQEKQEEKRWTAQGFTGDIACTHV